MGMKFAVFFIMLFGSLGASYLWAGPILTLILAFLWLDKVILSPVPLRGEMGIEFYSMSVILTGIVYGARTGFLFGLLAAPVMDAIRYWVIPPTDMMELGIPLPNLDTMIDGCMGPLAAGLKGYLSLTPLVFVCIVSKKIIQIFKNFKMDNMVGTGDILCIVFNVLLIRYIQPTLLGWAPLLMSSS